MSFTRHPTRLTRSRGALTTVYHGPVPLWHLGLVSPTLHLMHEFDRRIIDAEIQRLRRLMEEISQGATVTDQCVTADKVANLGITLHYLQSMLSRAGDNRAL